MATMVEVTVAFASITREGEVYPKNFKIGDMVDGYPAMVALRNGWGVAVGGDVNSRVKAPSDQSDAPAAGPLVRAKTRRVVDVDEGGETFKIAKGSIVDGGLASRLIADGSAVEIKDRGAAPENK